ncbi:3-methyl-2-oxobutanoate hydroxymethyltransferase [Hahella sp. CCB-MM4]|uniref:3-methyl-2-oxobutanoate hydroxymethyltransferase n=1 Tax=Hahella sp. (strain CCB-MM4) TaxID=1926491 RepID=UPI000B9B9834|nr:3-methyl-2-oxobutanoate hydroxymethyltransferase [Hahella sp. CCB-MM4]OZG75012.1 3-methyl-2-oxobutanoate hydroxymethyltransferase [Hahella sp. CCB-MM4]
MKMQAQDFLAMKAVKPIAMLTAYTCPVARGLEKAGIPVILVGDTVGMVEMGFESTRDVTIEHMEYHIGAVRRGAPDTHIIGDLPYNTDRNPEIALVNARRLIAAGADSVKLEGPKVDVIEHLVSQGIPVVGHTGLTPQTAKNFAKVGRTESDAKRIKEESVAIQKAGAFMLVLEHIPYELANVITATLAVPTIGIGAGPNCDGQVLVINDALGLGDYWPPFSKQYAHVSQSILEVAKLFSKEVESMEFPNNIIQFSSSGKR